MNDAVASRMTATLPTLFKRVPLHPRSALVIFRPLLSQKKIRINHEVYSFVLTLFKP